MTTAACSLAAGELAAQLDRYRALRRHAAQRLAISVDHPDRRPILEAIADALGNSRAADLPPDSTQAQMRTAPGGIGCCSPSALETCCEPKDKQECCGQPANDGSMLAAPSRCGCNT